MWPDGVIDHRNRKRADNRIDNLRDTTQAINTQNMVDARPGSATGILGVSANGAGFMARISVNRKSRHLGTFPTAGEAEAAYLAAKMELHDCPNL